MQESSVRVFVLMVVLAPPVANKRSRRKTTRTIGRTTLDLLFVLVIVLALPAANRSTTKDDEDDYRKEKSFVAAALFDRVRFSLSIFERVGQKKGNEHEDDEETLALERNIVRLGVQIRVAGFGPSRGCGRIGGAARCGSREGAGSRGGAFSILPAAQQLKIFGDDP
jgi:hypothetical protein